MSKKVIVFSTYFNSPFRDDVLFNPKSSTPFPMSDKKLCDYFWNDIKDNINAKDVLKELPSYIKNEGKDEIEGKIRPIINDAYKELEAFVSKYKEIIDKDLTSKKINKDNEYKWIKTLKILMDLNKLEDSQLYMDLFDKYKKCDEESIKIDFMRTKGSQWIADNLKNEGQQEKFNVYLTKDRETPPAPWIYHRFSYYRLNDFSDDVVVYAVWPIEEGSPVKDEENKKWLDNAWIDALSTQFLTLNEDAEKLYLILHDKDIKCNEISGVLDYPRLDSQTTVRTIALFQHTGEFGEILKDAGQTSKDLLDYVESKLTTRGLLFDLYELAIKGNLSEIKVKILSDDKFKNITNIISNLDEKSLQEGKQDIEYLRLISILNDEIKNIELGETNN